MTMHTQEQRQAFLDNLDDKRHGTTTGYYMAYCQCEKCVAFREEHNRQVREKARKKSRQKKVKAAAKQMPKPKCKPKYDVCTVDEAFVPMMGKPTIKKNHCVVCGSTEMLEQHHPVKRSEGTLVLNGHEVAKPTLTLCKECHRKIHDKGTVYFKWVDAYAIAQEGLGRPLIGSGWYEFLEITDERARAWKEAHRLPNGKLPSRIGYMNALEMDGWERIR